VRRGPFNNSGTKDAGVDKDWDLKQGVYTYKNKNDPNVREIGPSRFGDIVDPFSIRPTRPSIANTGKNDNAASK